MPDRVILLHGFGGLLMALPIDRIVDHLFARLDGEGDRHCHFVAHSMGGLVLRSLLTRHRPVNLGRVVMLGTPQGGSEIAELLHRLYLHCVFLDRSAPLLRPNRPDHLAASLGEPSYLLDLIADDRSSIPWLSDRIFKAPNDGKVSVSATHLHGSTDHMTLPVTHTAMLFDPNIAGQVVHFLRFGRFVHTDA